MLSLDLQSSLLSVVKGDCDHTLSATDTFCISGLFGGMFWLDVNARFLY